MSAAALAWDGVGFGRLWAEAGFAASVDKPLDHGHNERMDIQDWVDIQASLRGDGGAYARLVRRHQQDIAERMWRFTRDAAEHEELVQDVFVEAYFSLPRFRGDAPFAHWLHVIATRVGYRFWKRRARRRERRSVSLDDCEAAARPDAPASEAAELAHRLLAGLRPKDRLVLTLLYLEGRSVAETAALTGWSESAVKVRAFRARERLRAAFEQSDEEKSGERP